MAVNQVAVSCIWNIMLQPARVVYVRERLSLRWSSARGHESIKVVNVTEELRLTEAKGDDEESELAGTGGESLEGSHEDCKNIA